VACWRVSARLELNEQAVEQLPNRPGVFLLHMKDGAQEPLLSRTRVLKRRLLRLSRMPNLRDAVDHVEYWFTGSTLEAQMLLYSLARTLLPQRYLKLLNLRMPFYVRISFANRFPRSQIVSQLPRTPGINFGPFPSRVAAERFDAQFLDLFQLRRCPEDLQPSILHPGCVYGEMGMCLRPCQEQVSVSEYQTEVDRASEFLATSGLALLQSAIRVRDGFSDDMDFEAAARQHKRVEKIEEVRKLRDEMALPVDRLHAIAVTPSVEPEAVELSVFRGGHWQGSRRLSFRLVEGKPVSLDRTVRDVYSEFGAVELAPLERQEYLAIAARWFYSSWRDGELLFFDNPAEPPYRKLVHAISRVHRGVVGTVVTPDCVPVE
jgi:excinuclease ABC subunit C